MFEKEAEEYATQFNFYKQVFAKKNFLAGAEFGFQKGIKAKINTTTISDYPIKNQKARECKFCENYEFVKSLHKPGIDEFDGSKITYRYTAAYVDEVLVNGKSRGRTTHYTWKKLNFCPVCGKKLK